MAADSPEDLGSARELGNAPGFAARSSRDAWAGYVPSAQASGQATGFQGSWQASGQASGSQGSGQASAASLVHVQESAHQANSLHEALEMPSSM